MFLWYPCCPRQLDCCVCVCVRTCVRMNRTELTFSCLPAADVSGVDWMVRHGRSLALAIAVKSAPEKLNGKDYCDTVTEMVLTNATADRVSANGSEADVQLQHRSVACYCLGPEIFACGQNEKDYSFQFH